MTAMVKTGLQLRWVHVLRLGWLQGVINGCASFIARSSSIVVLTVFIGRLLIINSTSRNCSIVGFIAALMSILRSDGSARATNLGFGTMCAMVR